MNKILSIVILCFNKYNWTKSCLKDLSLLPEDHEIIVVDNGSTDETEKELTGNNKIVYCRSKENLGFAKGCNLGYSLASADNVLFLNNDIRVKSHYTSWTAELIKYCNIGLVGPTMGQLDSNFNFIKEANEKLTGPNVYMSGWCLASSKKNWNKLKIKRNDEIEDIPQVWSEEFGLAYHEDTDLSFRASKIKLPFQVVNIPVVHFGKVSSQQLNTNALYQNSKKVFIKKWK